MAVWAYGVEQGNTGAERRNREQWALPRCQAAKLPSCQEQPQPKQAMMGPIGAVKNKTACRTLVQVAAGEHVHGLGQRGAGQRRERDRQLDTVLGRGEAVDHDAVGVDRDRDMDRDGNGDRDVDRDMGRDRAGVDRA